MGVAPPATAPGKDDGVVTAPSRHGVWVRMGGGGGGGGGKHLPPHYVKLRLPKTRNGTCEGGFHAGVMSIISP